MVRDRHSWNRHLRNIRSALTKRDALASADGPGLSPDSEGEADRERRAWAAKARANLKRLARLVREASDRAGARATLHQLRGWYDNPAPGGRRPRRNGHKSSQT
ncbi:hypothetical protein [Thiohalorhabdus sp.]|uniref:hypothetical protein n=1 Tax=Thiohalorhabdus sp. TaxID=3094134 RepID=UPI002FC324AC